MRRARGLLSCAGLVLLAACGGDARVQVDEAAGPLAGMAVALERAETATARVHYRFVGDEAAIDMLYPQDQLRGDAEFTLDGHRVRLKLRSVEGDMRFEQISIDSVAYLQAPAEPCSENMVWLRHDFAQLVDGERAAALAGSPTPGELLRVLAADTGIAETVGTDNVGGTRTTHYRATFEPGIAEYDRSALAGAGFDPDAWEAYLEVLRDEFGVDHMAMDVWIGDDGLPRRQIVRFSVAGFLRATGLEIDGDVDQIGKTEYDDFGVPVTIEAPTEGVVEYRDYLDQYGREPHLCVPPRNPD